MPLAELVALAALSTQSERMTVIRTAFEDRHAMILVGPPDGGKGRWFAFNPRTAGLYKVWDGELDRRGKVFDFSQENSRAKGTVVAEAPSELLRLPDGPSVPGGWDMKGVAWRDGGWRFESDGASVTSPPFEVDRMQDVYVAFDEASRKSRFTVEVLSADGEPTGQWFQSATHVTSETEWQWNYKRIEVGQGKARISVRQAKKPDGKALRGLRVFGDAIEWEIGGKPVRGAKLASYEHTPSGSVLVDCRLLGQNGEKVVVTWPLSGGPYWETGYPAQGNAAATARQLGRLRRVARAEGAGSGTPAPRPASNPHTGSVLGQPTVPGITVRAWDVGKNFERRPSVVAGQTANAYYVTDRLELRTSVPSEYGEMKSKFVGEAVGWIQVEASGRFEFELEADDGGALTLGERAVCWVDDESRAGGTSSARGTAELEAGLQPFRVAFFQREGGFLVRLKWRTVGSVEWQVLAAPTARTEPGQTFVTSPGVKRADEGGPDSPPGVGRPLVAVHPSMELENLRGPDYQPAVGGLAFLPDGRLAVANWNPRGTVEILSNLQGPGPVAIHEVASGLSEPLGVAWHGGHLYVAQKGEVTRLVDLDGDEVTDRYETVSTGWPMSQNYHEFTFNLLPFQGRLNVTTSVPLRGGHTNYTPGSASAFANGNGPGSWLSIDPASGAWERAARGLRTPNGMGVGVDGHIYVCDNQGSWLPASTMGILRRDAFYGHQETPDGIEKAEPPVVWFPHGEIGNSPSQPVLIPDGPYRGQMLVGDVTYGGLQRVFVEKVNGVYQGTVFRHSQGLEAGVNRIAWGPDGCLYVGGVGSNGNWNHQGHLYGLQRLRPKKASAANPLPLELLEVRSRKGGFDLLFTERLDSRLREALLKTEVRQWRYERTIGYGGPKLDEELLEVADARIEDGVARLLVPGLKAGRVVYMRFHGLGSQGESLYSPESWTTINELSTWDGTGGFGYRGTGFEQSNRSWSLFDKERLWRWRRVSDGTRSDWPFEDGVLTVKAGDGTLGSNDIGYAPFDGYRGALVHVEWLSPPGGNLADQTNGNSGVKLDSRYEIQIMNAPGIADNPPQAPKFNEAGAVYRQHAPKVNPSYGPGVWQTYDIQFWYPRFSGGTKVQDAVITVYWNGVLVIDRATVKAKTGASVEEGPFRLPLLLQDHPTGAEGPVRFRNIFMGELMEPPDAR